MSRLITSAFLFTLGLIPSFAQPTTDHRQLTTAGSTRPNVLFLAVDDMNDWVGCLGGYPGEVYTPNLDRLAEMGTAFTNAHCAAPVCCPSRAATMSGLLPTTTGIYNNQHWWKPNRPDLRTIPIHFRENGYYTIGSGKIFHHTAGNNPPNQWHHFQRMLFNDNAWIRHGSANYPWTKPKPRPKEFPYSGIKLYSGEADWGVLPLPEAEYDDFVAADYAAGFLSIIPSRDAPPADPFFLACGLFHPHMPWYVPQRFLDLYPRDKVVVPTPKPDDLDDVPPAGKMLALAKSGDLKKIREAGKWRTAVQHYLASISFADAQIGRIMDALHSNPRTAANTIVVLWSDHGWHLGEKGHWHKRTLWEEATRVPFIVVVPPALANKLGIEPNQRCAEAVSLIDLFPTLIELCALPKVDHLDGQSLVPWLVNPEKPRKQPAIIVEERGHLAVRSTRYRYIRYTTGEEELYDHQNDPNEWTNLAKHPEHTTLKSELNNSLPKTRAKPALTKKAFKFDPDTFTFTNKQTGQVIKGQ